MKRYIICTLLAIVLVLIGTVISLDIHERTVERRVVEYLKENTEDKGDCVIFVKKCDWKSGFDGTFYIAYMIDNDGDQEVCIVTYYGKNNIEEYNIWWD